jgi:hypothetical protein
VAYFVCSLGGNGKEPQDWLSVCEGISPTQGKAQCCLHYRSLFVLSIMYRASEEGDRDRDRGADPTCTYSWTIYSG